MQVRARHAIPSNSKDFSTRESGDGGSAMVIVIVVTILGFAGLMFFLTKK